ncbi:MAG: ABC transporter permease, partial [Longimicrobiales bacterium]
MKRVPGIRFSVTERAAAEEEVRAELEEHYRATVALLVARGWSEEAARAEVHRRFGDEQSYRAELEGLARRRARRRRLRRVLTVSAEAFRSALREVRRNPGPSIGVALILAVGIGVNGAVFRVIDRLLLSPPPHVADPSQVRRLHQTVRYGTNPPGTIESFTYRDVRALRTAGVPASIGAVMLSMPETLGAGEDAVRVRVARVDSLYLPLLGVPVALGRTLLRDDHKVGAVPVAVLGHALWTSRFGRDQSVIGRTVRLAEREYEVVGVLPSDFAGAQKPATDLWIPLEPDARLIWGANWEENPNILAFKILVRLPERVDGAAWTARMESVLQSNRSGKDPPGELLALAASSLAPGSGPDPGVMVSVSRWLAGVSLLVLLVACANAANLFLAHGERRRRATALRKALGAGAGVLRLEQLARSLILALLGGVLSVLAAVWGGRLLEALFLEGMELPTSPDMGRLLAYTGSIAVLASLLCGAIPALRAPRGDVRPVLEKGARVVGGGGRVRRALVCVQVGLCMLLLVGAGLFVGSFRSALDVDIGFDYERLLVVRLEQEPGSERPRSALYDDVAQRLTSLSEVSSSATAVGVPFVLLYGLSGGLPGEEDLD